MISPAWLLELIGYFAKLDLKLKTTNLEEHKSLDPMLVH